MKIGDYVKTEHGNGFIICEEFGESFYDVRRFGVEVIGLDDNLYPDNIMYFFENHLTMITRSI